MYLITRLTSVLLNSTIANYLIYCENRSCVQIKRFTLSNSKRAYFPISQCLRRMSLKLAGWEIESRFSLAIMLFKTLGSRSDLLKEIFGTPKCVQRPK